jgi:hypothetical protein
MTSGDISRDQLSFEKLLDSRVCREFLNDLFCKWQIVAFKRNRKCVDINYLLDDGRWTLKAALLRFSIVERSARS